jgi:hypothetical protein
MVSCFELDWGQVSLLVRMDGMDGLGGNALFWQLVWGRVAEPAKSRERERERERSGKAGRSKPCGDFVVLSSLKTACSETLESLRHDCRSVEFSYATGFDDVDGSKMSTTIEYKS